jgi:hypothetical protein
MAPMGQVAELARNKIAIGPWRGLRLPASAISYSSKMGVKTAAKHARKPLEAPHRQPLNRLLRSDPGSAVPSIVTTFYDNSNSL